MASRKNIWLYFVLISFVINLFVPLRPSQWADQTSVADSMEMQVDLEDFQDASDAEDETEDHDRSPYKEFSFEEYVHYKANVLLALQQQQKIFTNHHPSVITPPPRG